MELRHLPPILAAAVLAACGESSPAPLHQNPPGTEDPDPIDEQPGEDHGDPLAGSWAEGFVVPGLYGAGASVRAVVQAGDDWIAGGLFEAAGPIAARNVARWDGSRWHPLGEGLELFVSALAWDEATGTLYAAGRGVGFDGGTNAVFAWDGSAWSEIGGVDGFFTRVEALQLLPDGSLGAAGAFEGIDGVDAANLARWDGSAWGAWGTATPDAAVHTIASTSAGICIAGAFSQLGEAAGSVGCWSDAAADWLVYGAPVSGLIDALADDASGALVVAGLLGVEGVSGAGIARWNGEGWELIGGGMGGGSITRVRALLRLADDSLLAAGSFTRAGGNAAARVARFDGTAWEAVGSGLEIGATVVGAGEEGAFALAETPAGFFVAGSFAGAGGRVSSNLAAWREGAWHPVADEGVRFDGISGIVNASALGADGTLYVGGLFDAAGTAAAVGVAARVEGNWQALGEGLPGMVVVLAVAPDGELWAVGDFDAPHLGGYANVVRWDGAAWHVVGAPANASVRSLTFDPATGHAWVGGDFTQIGEVEARNVARWDGERWQAAGEGLGDGVLSRVGALAFDAAGDLWAGGIFERTGAGGVARYLARWDGTSWTEGAGGLSGSVSSLLATEEGLLVVGHFARADGTPVNSVARWDGEAWTAFGEGFVQHGLPARVTAVATAGPWIFVTGTFDDGGEGEVGIFDDREPPGDGAADTEGLRHVAVWDGEAWRPLGAGLDDLGESLVVDGHALWVTGTFRRAGGQGSFGVARWVWE